MGYKKNNRALKILLIVSVLSAQIMPSVALADPMIPTSNTTVQPAPGVSAANLQSAENAAQANIDHLNQSVQAQNVSTPADSIVQVVLGDFQVQISKNVYQSDEIAILKTKGHSSSGGTYPFKQRYTFKPSTRIIYFSQDETGKTTADGYYQAPIHISETYQPETQSWYDALDQMISDVEAASALSQANDQKLNVIAAELATAKYNAVAKYAAPAITVHQRLQNLFASEAGLNENSQKVKVRAQLDEITKNIPDFSISIQKDGITTTLTVDKENITINRIVTATGAFKGSYQLDRTGGSTSAGGDLTVMTPSGLIAVPMQTILNMITASRSSLNTTDKLRLDYTAAELRTFEAGNVFMEARTAAASQSGIFSQASVNISESKTTVIVDDYLGYYKTTYDGSKPMGFRVITASRINPFTARLTVTSISEQKEPGEFLALGGGDNADLRELQYTYDRESRKTSPNQTILNNLKNGMDAIRAFINKRFEVSTVTYTSEPYYVSGHGPFYVTNSTVSSEYGDHLFSVKLVGNGPYAFPITLNTVSGYVTRTSYSEVNHFAAGTSEYVSAIDAAITMLNDAIAKEMDAVKKANHQAVRDAFAAARNRIPTDSNGNHIFSGETFKLTNGSIDVYVRPYVVPFQAGHGPSFAPTPKDMIVIRDRITGNILSETAVTVNVSHKVKFTQDGKWITVSTDSKSTDIINGSFLVLDAKTGAKVIDFGDWYELRDITVTSISNDKVVLSYKSRDLNSEIFTRMSDTFYFSGTIGKLMVTGSGGRLAILQKEETPTGRIEKIVVRRGSTETVISVKAYSTAVYSYAALQLMNHLRDRISKVKFTPDGKNLGVLTADAWGDTKGPKNYQVFNTSTGAKVFDLVQRISSQIHFFYYGIDITTISLANGHVHLRYRLITDTSNSSGGSVLKKFMF